MFLYGTLLSINPFLAYGSICVVFFSWYVSMGQIAWWIFCFKIWRIKNNIVPLHRNPKHSGALLGSNSMRNTIARNDKH